MKDVTIVIPAYNEQEFIEKSIRSAVSQAEFVFVSDNCSTDRTLDICKNLAREYSNLIVFEQTSNMGSGKNGEFLYSKVETKYVLFVGAHDYISPNYVEELKKSIKANKNSIAAFSPAIIVDYADNILNEILLEDLGKGLFSDEIYERVYASIIMEYNFPLYGLFLTSVFKNNFIETTFAGVDHALISRCSIEGKFVRNNNTRFYLRVRTEGDSSENYMKRLVGEASQFDMSCLCLMQLYFLDQASQNNKILKENYLKKATHNLQGRYTKSCYQFIDYQVEQINKCDEQYIIYGFGSDCDTLLSKIGRDKIAFIVDMDKEKHYSVKNGLIVKPLTELLLSNHKIIISLIGRFKEVSDYLKEQYGINRERLISFDIELNIKAYNTLCKGLLH